MAVSDPATSLLPWHAPLWQQFLALHRSGRLPHAMLLSGPRGVGKQRFAEALLGYLLCASPGETACGQCHGCHMLAAVYHPDLLRVSPEEGKRQIRIDPIREVNAFVSQTAQQGGHRVIVLSPAEAMNVAAANALLKSLERHPRVPELARAREADDLRALAALARDPEIAALAGNPGALRLLWEVCQVPDFQKILSDQHASLLGRMFRYLAAPEARLPEDWVAREIDRLDRNDGNIDALDIEPFIALLFQ